MHPFPILERWISKDVVVERQNNTVTSPVTKVTLSPKNKSMTTCPYLLSTNDDSMNSIIDDEDDNNDNNNENSNGPDLIVKNFKTTHVNETKNHTNTAVTVNKATHQFIVQKNTQVVMFPSDWKHDKSWSVFGAGKRACPGTLKTPRCG